MKANNELRYLPPEGDIESKTVLKQLNKATRALAELKAYAEVIPNKEIQLLFKKLKPVLKLKT